MRVRHPIALAATCFAAATALVGCSGSSTAGQPTPAPSTSQATEPMLAPKVSNPLTNTKDFESDPCAALPTSQVETVGGKVSRTDTSSSIAGKTCEWIFDGSTGNVFAGFIVGNKSGLNSLYLENQKGHLTTFQPHDPVEGYPAVVYGQGGEGPGTCALAVGIRDDLTYTVNPQLREGNPAFANPCDMAAKLAGDLINVLKAR